MNAVMEVIKKRRSVRRFKQTPISDEILRSLGEAGRLSPTGGNLQPLRFIAVKDKALTDELFPNTHWAAYIPGYRPSPEAAPTALLLVLVDTDIKPSADTDAGAACENIMLAAESFGVASCWIGSLNREAARRILRLPENLSLHSTIALGYPDQTCEIDEDFNGSVKYYEGEDGVFRVPKRRLDDIFEIR